LGLSYRWSKIVFGVERYFQLYRGQRLHLLCTLMCCPCGAHTLYFNVKSFVVCVCCCPLILITPLVFSNSSSVWSVFKIRSNNVHRYFQLYRGQLFYLVLNATFNYIVVEETTDLTQSHWQTYFKDEHQIQSLIIYMKDPTPLYNFNYFINTNIIQQCTMNFLKKINEVIDLNLTIFCDINCK
jgi:hypothetical protein